MNYLEKFASLTVDAQREFNMFIAKKLKLNICSFKLPKNTEFVDKTKTVDYKVLNVNPTYLISNMIDDDIESESFEVIDPLTQKLTRINLNSKELIFFGKSKEKTLIEELVDLRYKNDLFYISMRSVNSCKFEKIDNNYMFLSKNNPLLSINFIKRIKVILNDNNVIRMCEKYNNTVVNSLNLKLWLKNDNNDSNIELQNNEIKEYNNNQINNYINELLYNEIFEQLENQQVEIGK